MTYTLFTLFPILLFALVTLWKLKLNYDEDIFQLEKKLSKVGNQHHIPLGNIDQCLLIIIIRQGFPKKG